jgi:transcriptional regulator with XRE-family HTH domain
MITFGSKIKELREKKDLSLREFAKRLGCSAPHISDIEHGRRFPSDEMLSEIAKNLDISVDELKDYDTRIPLNELKRMAEKSPTYGIALRKLAEKNVTAEEIFAFVNNIHNIDNSDGKDNEIKRIQNK